MKKAVKVEIIKGTVVPALKCPMCSGLFLPQRNGAGYKYCSNKCAEESKKQGSKKSAHQIYLEKRYGLKPLFLKQIIKKQRGRCKICSIKLNGQACMRSSKATYEELNPPGNGIICSRCSRALALFYDDPDLLRKALKYIES